MSGTKAGILRKTAQTARLFLILTSLLMLHAQAVRGDAHNGKDDVSAFLAAALPIHQLVFDSTLTDSVPVQPQQLYNKKRLSLLLTGGTAAYIVTLAGLNELWYKEQPRSPFHFFNDNTQWKQIDKAGHIFTTYQISRLGTQAFRWTGLSPRKAILLGGVTGLLFQTPIELMDGLSTAYGASWGDVAANTAGAALWIGQHWIWQEERIHPKFSFYPTFLARLRPNTLGKNLLEQSLKDYNGQTYWLAFDVKPWLSKESRFPAWLNISLGYGAQNMIYAENSDNQAQGYDAYRQYYLSLDINFTKIPTRSRFVRSLFFLLNTVHIPAPALEFNRKQGVVVHPLYF